MKKYLFLLLFLSENITAQQVDHFMGARSMGLGGSVVTISDEYSSLNNSAGIAGLENSCVVFAFRNFFGVDGLNMVAAGGFLKQGNGAYLLNFSRFGDKLFSEQKIGTGYSHKIGFIQLGIKLNYLQYRNALFGSAGNLVIEFGGIANLFPCLRVGAHIFNLNQANIGREQMNPVPTHMKAGISYEPGENILVVGTVDKTIGEETVIKLGIEHFLKEALYIRTGISMEPATYYAGIGLPLRRLQVDQAIAVHPVLGLSFQFSTTFKFL